MPKLESLLLSIPTHWMAPILYGDTSGLDDTETVAFTRWLDDTLREVGHGKPTMIGTIHDNEYFAMYHDAQPYGVLACMCYDVELLVEAAEDCAPAPHQRGYTPRITAEVTQ